MKPFNTSLLPLVVIMVANSLTSCTKNEVAEPLKTTELTAKVKDQTSGNSNEENYMVSLKTEFAGPGVIGKIHAIIAKYNLGNKSHRVLKGNAFNGFVISLSPAEAELLKSDSDLAFLEIDRQLSLPPDVISEPPVPTVDPGPPIINYVISPLPGQNVSWGATLVGIGDGSVTGRTAWIIDSGIKMDHPDLNVDAVRSRSFLSTTTNPGDEYGHGTTVAGILGAKNNGFGVVGIASGATLVSLRIGNATGGAFASALVSALNYAADNAQPGDVVNISYGSSTASLGVENAVKAVADLGIYITIAAGNSSVDASTFCPAGVNYPNVFTVSGLRPDGNFMGMSNWGPTVDYCAPGNSVVTTLLNGLYGNAGGTSMAAPHLAGILLVRGSTNIPIAGYAVNDPDGNPDPIPHL